MWERPYALGNLAAYNNRNKYLIGKGGLALLYVR
jgi:hypothetical protein